MIKQEIIDAIKRFVDLVAHILSRGIDTEPSMFVYPKEGLWNCFGCNVSGDVIKFEMLYENLRAAAARAADR